MADPLPTAEISVTYLEMTRNPQRQDTEIDGCELRLMQGVEYDFYMNLYREIGRDYLWNYRPGQSREEIEQIIKSPAFLLYVLYCEEQAIGMAECDLASPKDIEIVHFGLMPPFLNKGLGKQFLQKLLHLLWSRNPDRIHLSTCEWDHPRAKGFYQQAGFQTYKTTTAIFKDYRYNGFYAMSDAPRIPHQPA